MSHGRVVAYAYNLVLPRDPSQWRVLRLAWHRFKWRCVLHFVPDCVMVRFNCIAGLHSLNYIPLPERGTFAGAYVILGAIWH